MFLQTVTSLPNGRLACARLSPPATSHQLPATSFLILLSAFTFQVSSFSSQAQTKPTPKTEPFAKLAKELAEEAPGGRGQHRRRQFRLREHELLSPFSSMLRDELEIALGETGKFRIVTRDRLADLQMEGKFQGKGVLEPGTGVEKVSIEGVKGIVRGRFYATGDEVTVFAELAWLEGGEIKKARLAIPSDEVKAKIWPDPSRRRQATCRRDQTAERRAKPCQHPRPCRQPLGRCSEDFKSKSSRPMASALTRR